MIQELHQRAQSLEEGDKVSMNGEMTLTVTGTHKRESDMSRGSDGPYHIIELEGGKYHIVTWGDATYGPVLHDESDESGYPDQGKRVTTLNRVSV